MNLYNLPYKSVGQIDLFSIVANIFILEWTKVVLQLQAATLGIIAHISQLLFKREVIL